MVRVDFYVLEGDLFFQKDEKNALNKGTELCVCK